MRKWLRTVHDKVSDASLYLLYRLGRYAGSAILPSEDTDLVTADLLLSRSLRKEAKGVWVLPPTLPPGLSEKHPDLVEFYAVLAAGDRDEWVAGIPRLKGIVSRTPPGPLQGAVLRRLIDDLCVHALGQLAEGDHDRFTAERNECRRYSEMALASYRGTAWEPVLWFCAEAGLGVLDYHADETLSAKIHLVRAVKLHKQALKVGDFHTLPFLGLVCLSYGQLLFEERDVDGAVRHLRLAAHHLHDNWKPQALVWLASVELRADRAYRARAAARQGLRLIPKGNARWELEDDLKYHLAMAHLEMGKVAKAKELLRDVVTRGVSRSKVEWAREHLEKLEQSSSRR